MRNSQRITSAYNQRERQKIRRKQMVKYLKLHNIMKFVLDFLYFVYLILRVDFKHVLFKEIFCLYFFMHGPYSQRSNVNL